MSDIESGGVELGRIHRRNNDKKFFCHFTGFLEGIVASGLIENGEFEPLLAECTEFIERVSDNDANDIIEDFKIDVLEFQTLEDAIKYRSIEIDMACEKSRLNRFLGFCRGIACDGVITLQEAKRVIEILDEHPELVSTVGVKQIWVSCVDAVFDGILSSEESLEICESISMIVGDCYGDTGLANTFGVANFTEKKLSNLDQDLNGAVVVLTGSFQTSPRKEFEDVLCEYGAQIARHISGNTEFLVVGGEAARDWVEMNRGTKMRKAQQLRFKTERPHFVSEIQLLRLIKGLSH